MKKTAALALWRDGMAWHYLEVAAAGINPGPIQRLPEGAVVVVVVGRHWAMPLLAAVAKAG